MASKEIIPILIANNLDMFYTKQEVANNCYKLFYNKMKSYLNEDSVFIEPSAGSGAFLNSIPNTYTKKGFDIFPNSKSIQKLNFLKNKLPIKNLIRNNTFFIGNPPFGSRGKLAIDFINKSYEYADSISFILPNTFLKYLTQSKINSSLKLILSQPLPKNSFIFQNKEIDINCIFQIWTTLGRFKDIRIKNKPPTVHTDFELFQYNNTPETKKYFDKEKYKWDFAIPRQGYYDYSQKVYNPNKLNSKIQWVFVKINKEVARNIFYKIDFSKLARKNTTVPGFGKADIVEEYKRICGGNNA